MSAARKKGKWTGGCLVLGYDVDPRTKRLIVNPEEASRVRTIFALFEQHRSVRLTLDEILRRGWTLKKWTCRNGKVHGGGPFSENTLRRMLVNALYAGRVRYKETIYPGEHEAIVDPPAWQRVQSLVERYPKETSPRQKHMALLRGLLHCESCGVPMIPVHVARHGHRYRYYVCRTRNKGSAQPCPSRPLPAQEIDDAVFRQVSSGEPGEPPTDLAAKIEFLQQRIERVGYHGASGRVNIRFRQEQGR
jgi:site-specific DNA recombinase